MIFCLATGDFRKFAGSLFDAQNDARTGGWRKWVGIGFGRIGSTRSVDKADDGGEKGIDEDTLVDETAEQLKPKDEETEPLRSLRAAFGYLIPFF